MTHLDQAAATAYALAGGAPFLGLLLTVALAPRLLPGLWHAHYGKIVFLWAIAFLVPDAVTYGTAATLGKVVETALHEYIPFVLLLGTLFIVAGGIRVTGTPHGTPGVNTAMLALGTVTASWIGTTGAAMLMLRPLIRANRHRRRTTHVFVFFIFLVANVGGALTPLGDPPLFLGYLAGVPFFWPMTHLLLPTLMTTGGLLAVFYALDSYIYHGRRGEEPAVLPEIEKLGIEGRINLLLLAAVVAVVLLRGVWRPALGVTLWDVPWDLGAIVTDAMLLAIALLSLAVTRQSVRRANEFTWAPMTEVAILFAAIFITIVPVLAIIRAGASGPAGPLVARLMIDGVPDNRVFYWATGLLSAVLDNAPTYLVFLGFAGGNVPDLIGLLPHTLEAISAGAVYFGALTYIGNAPNLMVKSIAEAHGISMPSFLGYIGWAATCLLPWLLLVDVIFF